ncbi:hypothetical protein FACS1894190_06760 [Spirochaetia bacterium]|nr:hypothetical protein FACS1894190_06760 [Spirochaetia bacterium]
MDLECILAEIAPNENQVNCLKGVVSTLGNIFKNSSGMLKIKKVIPAGSLSKNTILRDHLEVDCVYILEHNGYSYCNHLYEIQRCLKENLPTATGFHSKNHSVRFNIKRKIGNVSVDLLPAFEINSIEQIQQVKNKDAYYGTTALFQREYFNNIKQYYNRFNDLVRLLKSWKETQNIPLSSYMLELIVANAVYNTKKGERFEFYFEVCFRTIQAFTDKRAIVPVLWGDHFDNSKIDCGYANNNLYIIDPSDPTENLAKRISNDDKDYIRGEAVKGINKLRKQKYSFLFE